MKKYLSIFFLAIILRVSVIELKAQWQQVNLGPAGGSVNAVTVIGSDVFAGTSSGINRSSNYGVNWEDVNSGLTLCFASNDSIIFAGTGSGVIISTNSGNSWGTPNPGMPYYITALAVNVFDILGRKVETIVDAEKLPGHYQVTFNASKLSSGVYFYRLTAGEFFQTKKLQVVK
jgi:hypothetical protein